MAWTTTTTRSTGFTLTAAVWNAEIVGNLKHLEEVGRASFTSNISITATAEASANTIVTLGSIVYENVPHLLEAYLPRVDAGAGSAHCQIVVFDGSTSQGWLSSVAGGTQAPAFKGEMVVIPTAAAHTYSIRGLLSAADTGTVRAGAGGSGNYLPGFIRISRIPV